MGEGNNKKLGRLIKRLARHDATALSGIAEEVERLLMAIGHTYYRNFADVEDAIHDLYFKLYEKAPSYHTNVSAKAWIVKIFINSIKSRIARSGREKRYLEREISYYKATATACNEQYVENHLFIKELVDGLSEEEKELFVCHYFCELTVREIASYLEQPLSTVHYRLKKLEEKIKKIDK